MNNPLVEPQPPPLNQEALPYSVDLVIRDLQDRKNFGISKYGTALTANNGRNNLIDCYQELLDLLVYMRSEIDECWIEPNENW